MNERRSLHSRQMPNLFEHLCPRLTHKRVIYGIAVRRGRPCDIADVYAAGHKSGLHMRQLPIALDEQYSAAQQHDSQGYLTDHQRLSPALLTHSFAFTY